MSTRGLYVLVKVLSVHRNYAFPCCVSCSTRVRTENDENIFSCSKCQQKYDKKHITYRYRVNMTVSDRTQVSNVTVFGHCLENFFGTSATHLKRFVEGLYLEKEELPLPVDQLVHQCIEQCFVGSMIRLCFRGLHPCLTDSQASRSSPTHLKNITIKMQEVKMNYLSRQQQNTSHLLASYISRPGNTEKNATVFELLKEYLVFFRCSKSMTPSCGSTNGPYPMSSSGPQHNTSLQRNSTLHYKGFRRKSSEDSNLMVSPLVLSCETRESSQLPTSSILNLNSEVDLPIQIDSELKSQTRMQNSAILDSSPNKTALMLMSMLNMDTSEECIGELSIDTTNNTENIHDKSRSLCNTSENLKCSNEPSYLTENIFHTKHDNERTHNEELAYLNSQSTIGKPGNIRNAIENEKQELQSDMDSFLDEDLSSFFINLSLGFNPKRIKSMHENSQYAKGEKPPIEYQPCNRLDDCHEFQGHLSSSNNSLQYNSDQISVLFPEELLLTDLEFSNFSFLCDYATLQEPRPSVSKTSPVTSSEEHTRTANDVFSCAVNFLNVERDSEEKQTAYSHGKNYCPNEKCRELPERMIMGTSGLNGWCYSDDSSTNKPPSQNKFSGTPAQLSFQSPRLEQTSTPVLFDDSRDLSESKLKSYRSLSLPEALQLADVKERGIHLNIHSTPMNSECERKFDDLSGDLQNYSGLFVDDRERRFSIGPTVSLNGTNEDAIKGKEDCPTTRKSLENIKHVVFSACSRMEEAPQREEGREQNFVESFSVRSERTPGESGLEMWRTSDQICPESPLLFSFSSTESNSYKVTPDIQQDSLLCASLLECSYLK